VGSSEWGVAIPLSPRGRGGEFVLAPASLRLGGAGADFLTAPHGTLRPKGALEGVNETLKVRLLRDVNFDIFCLKLNTRS
jgi:hypothetical protein